MNKYIRLEVTKLAGKSPFANVWSIVTDRPGKKRGGKSLVLFAVVHDLFT
jgi:hypothetical protein